MMKYFTFMLIFFGVVALLWKRLKRITSNPEAYISEQEEERLWAEQDRLQKNSEPDEEV
jgi:hypothetical protein